MLTKLPLFDMNMNIKDPLKFDPVTEAILIFLMVSMALYFTFEAFIK